MLYFFTSQCELTRAILLALAVCYYARLQEPKKRRQYVTEISQDFDRPLKMMQSHLFVEHIHW